MRVAKNLAKAGLSYTLDITERFGLIRLLERLDIQKPDLLRVLTYHRIDELGSNPDLDSSLISATPEVFSQQMDFVAANYDVMSLSDLLEARETGRRIPPRALMITFDDAYRDFAVHAWPVLKKRALPVTLFVPTGFPDSPRHTFWWERLHYALDSTTSIDPLNTPFGQITLTTRSSRRRGLKRLKEFVKSLPHERAMCWVDEFCHQLGASRPCPAVLSWADIRKLSSEGVTVGAHTQTHPLLTRVSLQDARNEVVASLRDIRREIGPAVVPVLAYPSGERNLEIVSMLKYEGVSVAFTTKFGINDMKSADLLQLRRINVSRNTGPGLFRTRLVSSLALSSRWQRH